MIQRIDLECMSHCGYTLKIQFLICMSHCGYTLKTQFLICMSHCDYTLKTLLLTFAMMRIYGHICMCVFVVFACSDVSCIQCVLIARSFLYTVHQCNMSFKISVQTFISPLMPWISRLKFSTLYPLSSQGRVGMCQSTPS